MKVRVPDAGVVAGTVVDVVMEVGAASARRMRVLMPISMIIELMVEYTADMGALFLLR